MRPRTLNILLNLFWACWVASASFPFIMLLRWTRSGDISEAYYGIFYVALIGLGAVSIELFRHQPGLARFGLISLGLSLAVFLLFGIFMGPLTD